MILVDFSNFSIISAMGFFRDYKVTPDLACLRKLLIKRLHDAHQALRARYGDEVVLAIDCDDGYWRKAIFAHYKAARKKMRDDSDFDFVSYFQSIKILLDEFKAHTPYKVVEASHAEADDIVAILAKRFASSQPVCVVSTDKDFIQLKAFHKSIEVYSIITGKYHKGEDYHIRLHIAQGDSGDGIPNICSDEDTLVVEGKRQKPLTAKLKQAILAAPNPQDVLTEAQKARYHLNAQLIDFDCIPAPIAASIIASYDASKADASSYMQYLVSHRVMGVMQ